MFKFRSVIHFELIFAKAVKFVTLISFFCACAHLVVPALFAEKMVFTTLSRIS